MVSLNRLNPVSLKRLKVVYLTGAYTNNIEVADYIQIQYSDLLEDYRFPEELYDHANMAPYWKTTPRFIEPAAMHNIIQHALQLHVTDTSEIYRFTDPKLPEKYAASHIWEDLQHYICVDWRMKTIQIITSGFD